LSYARDAHESMLTKHGPEEGVIFEHYPTVLLSPHLRDLNVLPTLTDCETL
jgi:hypothetical protein